MTTSYRVAGVGLLVVGLPVAHPARTRAAPISLFVILSEARDLLISLQSRSLASLRMTRRRMIALPGRPPPAVQSHASRAAAPRVASGRRPSIRFENPRSRPPHDRPSCESVAQ